MKKNRHIPKSYDAQLINKLSCISQDDFYHYADYAIRRARACHKRIPWYELGQAIIQRMQSMKWDSTAIGKFFIGENAIW